MPSELSKAARLNVALIQMVSNDNWRHNFDRIEALLEQACKGSKPDLVLLPENALCFGAQAQRALSANSEDVVTKLKALARHRGVCLVVGSLPMPLEAKIIDSRLNAVCLVIGSDGQVLCRYNKIHLFDVDVADAQGGYRESDTYAPGDTVTSFHLGAWQVGLSICYDLRFAELYRQLQDQGCNVICVPSAFTATTGEAHWESLLRARAIETQSYVLAANQGGRHGDKRETWGHSMIIDPWGKVLARCEKGEGLLSAELDINLVSKVRKDMPIAQHRRLN